ncbi:MAG: GAF and ANTAR domain-containing protein [Aeromicrobium sp.]
MNNDLSGDQYALIGRNLKNEAGVTATLESATSTALEIIENCDHAGITLVVKQDKTKTLAPTDHVAVEADKLQYETGQGPVVQSIVEEEAVYSADLRLEKRWPEWSSRAANELGVRSVLAMQLFVGPDALGSLNLYSDSPDAFGADDRVSSLALAAHIAIAFAAEREHQGVSSALINRTLIGQAQGMLMQRLDLTPQQSFSALVRLSQARNVKLHVIASAIVENGVRPDLFE